MTLDFSNEPIHYIRYKELECADYSKITTLEVSTECKGVDKLFPYLGKMKKLDTLVVNSGNKMDNLVDWSCMFENIPSSTLRQLEIYSNSACLESFCTLCSQLGNTNIESITIHQSKFSDSHLIALSDILSKCKLQELILEETNLTDFGITALASVISFSNLSKLVVRGLNITVDGLRAISNGIRGSTLKTLDIYSDKIKIGDWHHLYEHLESTLIESVGIYFLDAKASDALVKVLPKSNLTHLVIPADTPNIEKLLIASSNSKILGIQICIKFNHEAIMKTVERHLKYITADTLYIDYYNSRYPSSSRLFSEIEKSQIRYLTLSNVTFNHQLMLNISNQLPNSNLLSLTLTATNLDDELLRLLSNGVMNSELRYIDLSSNRDITSRGIIYFVGIVRYSTKLTKLDFRSILDIDEIPGLRKFLKKALGSTSFRILL
ncbi:hypothetical protein HK103_006274 [Boothiomyces macroporosus]|uniref:RNI-like protein n=1 Tax=Boothiomyces macroporosus TaxID=261099 RepID=A0AAD5UH45_9FUNG|nr:hypothetical protein HK103_006274 [Boothiomyces macroporosus]